MIDGSSHIIKKMAYPTVLLLTWRQTAYTTETDVPVAVPTICWFMAPSSSLPQSRHSALNDLNVVIWYSSPPRVEGDQGAQSGGAALTVQLWAAAASPKRAWYLEISDSPWNVQTWRKSPSTINQRWVEDWVAVHATLNQSHVLFQPYKGYTIGIRDILELSPQWRSALLIQTVSPHKFEWTRYWETSPMWGCFHSSCSSWQLGKWEANPGTLALPLLWVGCEDHRRAYLPSKKNGTWLPVPAFSAFGKVELHT
jgi:hypothetical protein